MTKFGIGQPVPRLEDPRFITGRGRYVDDIDLPLQCLRRGGHVAARACADQEHRHRQGQGGAGRARRADRRRRRGRQARQPRAGHARGHGRTEGLPDAASDPVTAARCARSATASPSSSPKRWRRRATPPSLIAIDYEPLPAVVSLEDAVKPGAPAVWDEVAEQRRRRADDGRQGRDRRRLRQSQARRLAQARQQPRQRQFDRAARRASANTIRTARATRCTPPRRTRTATARTSPATC